jgi:hypothetical protein
MPENRDSVEELMAGCLLILALGVVGIVVAIIQALVEFGRVIIEGALVAFPVLGLVAWITYKVETAYQSSRGESPESALRLLQEVQERAMAIFFGSGGIALFSILAFFGANSSSGERAALGWLAISGATCVTYLLILIRHQGREGELKAAEKRERELKVRRRQEEEAQEREKRERKLAGRLGDIDLFLEDHYFEGALLALDELEKEYREEGMTISQVRRRVKDAEFAYHKARAEPHLQRLNGLLAHLDQMKQAKRS